MSLKADYSLTSHVKLISGEERRFSTVISTLHQYKPSAGPEVMSQLVSRAHILLDLEHNNTENAQKLSNYNDVQCNDKI